MNKFFVTLSLLALFNAPPALAQQQPAPTSSASFEAELRNVAKEWKRRAADEADRAKAAQLARLKARKLAAESACRERGGITVLVEKGGHALLLCKGAKLKIKELQ